jgi:hypothetical protein
MARWGDGQWHVWNGRGRYLGFCTSIGCDMLFGVKHGIGHLLDTRRLTPRVLLGVGIMGCPVPSLGVTELFRMGARYV